MSERQKQHMGRSAGDERDRSDRDRERDGRDERRADAANPKADVERGTDEVPAPNEERTRGHRDDMGAGR